MADHYGDESQSASDQEELVGNSDLEDELSDYDDVPFDNLCKQSTATENDLNSGAGECMNIDPSTSHHKYNSQEMYDNEHLYGHKSKIVLFIAMIALLLTAFALLICFPFYLQQLAVEGKQNNAYGAILFVSTVVTFVFMVIAALMSYLFKWDNKLLTFPIVWTK